MDLVIHEERTATDSQRNCTSIEHLPDGVFVTDDEHHAYLVLTGRVLRWSPGL